MRLRETRAVAKRLYSCLLVHGQLSNPNTVQNEVRPCACWRSLTLNDRYWVGRGVGSPACVCIRGRRNATYFCLGLMTCLCPVGWHALSMEAKGVRANRACDVLSRPSPPCSGRATEGYLTPNR